MTRMVLYGADLSSSDLTGTSARQMDLYGANLIGTLFVNANLAGSSLTRASVGAASFVGADLRQASLRETRDLDEATWGDTVCPNGKVNDGNAPCTTR